MNSSDQQLPLNLVKDYLRKPEAGRPGPESEEFAAWRKFFDAFDPCLREFVARERLSHSDAQDLVQEAWLDVIRLLPTFDSSRGDMRNWLRRIVRSKACDLYRRYAKDELRATAANDVKHCSPDAGTPLQQAVVTERLASGFKKFCTHAPRKQLEIFCLCYLGGMPLNRAAGLLDFATANAARSSYFRAVARLRKFVREEEDTASPFLRQSPSELPGAKESADQNHVDRRATTRDRQTVGRANPRHDAPVHSALELLYAMADELGGLQANLSQKLQKVLDGLAGKSLGSLEDNKRLATFIQQLLNRLDLRVECPSCAQPARLRCHAGGNSKNGVFQFEHSSRGRKSHHLGSTTLPRLKLIPAPADGRRRKAPGPDAPRSNG